MASAVSPIGNLVHNYYQATALGIPIQMKNEAQSALLEDIHYFLSKTDTKTRLVAESVLCKQHLTITDKLAVFKFLELKAPQPFDPALHTLIQLNARLNFQNKKEFWKMELRQIERNDLRLSLTHRPNRTEVREEKREPANRLTHPPSSAEPERKPTRDDSSWIRSVFEFFIFIAIISSSRFGNCGNV